MLGELEAICTEGVGDNQLRASFDIRPMDFRHGGGIGEIEFIKAFIKAHAVGVEHGAHRAVSEDSLGGE